MKAILAREFGGPEVLKLEEVPDPTAGDGQVRVRIHAVGVNPYDTYMRAGRYAIKPDLPYTPGADAAGVIDQVGDGVTWWKVGDRVYVSGTSIGKAHGAYAALAVCVREPGASAAGANHVRAGCRPVRAVRHSVARAVRPRQRARGRHGSDSRRQRRRRHCRHAVRGGGRTYGDRHRRHRRGPATWSHAQGARHAINHRTEGYLDQITGATGGRGPDVILEMLANVNLDHDLTVVAPGGRVVVIGNRGRVEIDARKIMSKDCAVYGLALWGIPADEVRRAHEAIIAGLESGALNPVVGHEMPLADAAKAHVAVMEPGAHGKIVLIP